MKVQKLNILAQLFHVPLDVLWGTESQTQVSDNCQNITFVFLTSTGLGVELLSIESISPLTLVIKISALEWIRNKTVNQQQVGSWC